jgi:hypothetical protein
MVYRNFTTEYKLPKFYQAYLYAAVHLLFVNCPPAGKQAAFAAENTSFPASGSK